jgi:hypothetical protein
MICWSLLARNKLKTAFFQQNSFFFNKNKKIMKNFIFIFVLCLLSFQCSKEILESTQSGVSGSITRFAVFQNFMYVLNQNEVQTYDISDAKKPILVNELPTDYGLETITIYDNTVFLGSTTALYILDIGNPAVPVIQSKSDRIEDLGFSGCDPVVVKDNFAYSTIKIVENFCGRLSSESALIVYDVSDKSAPKVVGRYNLSIPNGLGIKDNHLFICDEGADKLVVFDISDPKNLVQSVIDVPIIDPFDLIIEDARMIVSTKTDFQIFEISDLFDIKKLAQISK